MHTSSNKPLLEERITDACLRRFIGYRLKRAYSTIRSDLLERLDSLDLRITTFSTLLLIVDNPGLRQSAIATALDIKRSNMVAIIDDLESRGWIARKKVPADRRAFALFATGAGSRVCKKAVAMAVENESTLLNGLSNAEMNTLSALLAKIELSS